MPDRRFLVLHGWQNRRPPEHWQWSLVEALRQGGEQVLYPQLPNPDRPSLDEWTELLHAELAQLGGGERVIVAHSLSALLWLHAVRVLGANAEVDRVLLVAPPSEAGLRPHATVEEFAQVPQDTDAVRSAAGSTRIVYGDPDPYCPEGADVAYSGLGLDTDHLPGAGHINPDSGYGPWLSVVEWCLDPTTRLRVR